MWRWGVILRLRENRVLVRATPAENRIDIRITGRENTRREALAQIRGHFEAIHRTFTHHGQEKAFRVRAWIYPRAYPDLPLSYDDLLAFEKDGYREMPVVYRGNTVRIPVRETLDGFVAPQERLEELKRRYPEEANILMQVFGDVIGSSLVAGHQNVVRQHIQAGVPPEVAETFQQLARAVQAMLPHLSPEDAEEVQDDLARLQEELRREKPRRKWYRVSLEGLAEAARKVGEIGEPVLKLALRLTELLHQLG